MSYFCQRCGIRVNTCRHDPTRLVRPSRGYNSFDEGYDSGSNVGQLGVDSSGDLTVGIDNGESIDLVNGDLVVDIGDTGFGIDTGIELF